MVRNYNSAHKKKLKPTDRDKDQDWPHIALAGAVNPPNLGGHSQYPQGGS